MPKNGNRPERARLRNVDYSDRELLGVIQDEAGADWATSEDIARAIGFTDGEGLPSPASRVVPRLNWMKNYGFIERQDEDGIARWRLSDIGRELLNGRLTKSVESALGRMGAGDQLLTMRALTRREAAQPIKTALRREYLHNTGGR